MSGRSTQRHAGAVRRLVMAAVLAGLALSSLGVGTAAALPPRDRDPNDPPGLDIPFVPPAHGFDWWIDSRFGSQRDGIVDFHWNEAAGSRHPGPAFTYDPAYVRPTALTARFDGCPTEEESWAPPGAAAWSYRWELRSPAGDPLGAPAVQRDCRWAHTFPIDAVTGMGQPTVVRLSITHPGTGAPWPGYPAGKTFDEQTVQVRDLLIVSLGDSYGSGEGSPDIPQVFDHTGKNVIVPARWQDRRCHRSAAAPAAQAALSLEAADRHSSVTFLSFACSGATISQPYFADQSPFDPYRVPPVPDGFQKPLGTGILGPYVGTEPPLHNGSPDYRDEAKLPSQVDQLRAALTNGGQLPPRQVAALTISGGGNDMGFGPLASVCTLYYECPEHFVDDRSGRGRIRLKDRFQQSVATMPGRYAALASALAGLPVGKVYLTQYPDPTKDSTGALCSTLLDDVLPPWMQPFLVLKAVADGSQVPWAPYQMDRAGHGPHDEVAFAANVVLPSINGAVAAAAAAHGWTLVDGIADPGANLFSGHGYCADDSWIRRAGDATRLQGPWHNPDTCSMVKLALAWYLFVAEGCVPPATATTTGTLHPTSDGYRAIAGRLVAKMQPDLVPPPPATPPQFADNRSASAQGANGWLVGRGPGQSCPSGLADCVIVDLAVVADSTSALRGVSLTRDGAPVACSPTGTTAGGLTCKSKLTNPTTYSWTLTFREDGIHRFEAVATARNGTVTHLRREFKVDLRDPEAGTATPTEASGESNGWFRNPVEVLFGGTDATGGSGVVGARFQVDGQPPQQAARVVVDGDGAHTVAYRPVDGAGRLGPPATLTFSVDRTPPAVACAGADGAWHAADVAIACTASDGGSGLADPADATFTLSTAVEPGAETADAPTASREVCDRAGNCLTAGPVGGNRVDRRPPTVSVTSPVAGSYYVDQVVTADYACSDGGSGLAPGTCQGTVPHGAALDTSSTGPRELSVQAADRAGNSTTATVAYHVVRRSTQLSYDGALSGDYHDPVAVAARLTDTAGATPSILAGAEVVFGLGPASCRAVTDGAGWARCTLTPEQAAGPAVLNVSYGGSARHQPSSAAVPFTVTHEQVTLTYDGPVVLANGDEVRVSATLREEGEAPVAGRVVTVSSGVGEQAQACTATSDGAGRAECTLTLRQPLGPGRITASFAGDGFYHPASHEIASVVFEYLPQGAFVVAGTGAAPGTAVTFWGAQWARHNGGPPSFKGYAPAVAPGPARPSCGGTWRGGPGDSSPPPALPPYLAVAVSGDVVKQGSAVSGPVNRVVVVRTDAGYGADPGRPGTGTVVATVCG